ncbi:hypothetical protein B9Z55_013392 [Caenorhabditis nigoni]|uniref:G-protein coupled receptors family 1 profile domain-containing protein n=1 Tax=Caenorhabditis nigoni TaxID=1611254 RepID=A0A2G5U1I0_9PELO|nr:hypothetical protein B9Z55_013392 [Caenorhabditis nigoni]
MLPYLELIFKIIHTVCFLIGCFFNVSLCYVAIFHSPSIIKTYSVIVINVALTNLGALVCDFLLQQRMIPSGFNLFYISYGPCVKAGPEFCFDIYGIMLHFYSYSLWLLILAFAYRYYVMLRDEPSRWALQLTIFLVYIPSFIMMTALTLDHADPSIVRKMLKSRFPEYNLSGLVITGSVDTTQFAAMFAIIHMTVLSTPITIGIWILRKMIMQKLTYKGIDLTSKTKNLHAQLLKALTLQATIPVFYLLGVIFYFIGQFGIWSLPIIEFSIFTSFLIVPILTPLSSLVYVSPYKRFVLKKVNGKDSKSKIHTSSVITLGV